jgi:hypothetical protein
MSRFGVATRGEPASGPEPVPLPDLRPRRRSRWPWGLLALVVLAGVAFGMWELGRTTAPKPRLATPPRVVEMLVTSRPLALGTRIVPSDLTVLPVDAKAALRGFVPLSREASLLGRTVLTPLPSGALLTLGDVTAAPFPPAGEQLVGLELKGGQAPVATLAAGDRVQVLLVPAASQPPYPQPLPVTQATVWAVGAGGQQGTMDVELLVPSADAVAIASAAAHDEIALVGLR